MDVDEQLEAAQDVVLDVYDAAVVYFDSLGPYGLLGWAFLVLGLLLFVIGAVLLAA